MVVGWPLLPIARLGLDGFGDGVGIEGDISGRTRGPSGIGGRRRGRWEEGRAF